MAKAVLHDYPASIHVVREVVAKRIAVQERRITEWHHNVVLLELSQSWSPYRSIEEVAGGHTRFGQDFRLKLSGQTFRISINDEHLELTSPWRCRTRKYSFCSEPRSGRVS